MIGARPSRPVRGLAALALLAAGAAPAASPAAPPPASASIEGREGHVVQATAKRAWLDVGSAEGLRAGETLELLRGTAKIPCVVEWLAEHRATCAGKGVQAGDKLVHQRSASGPREQVLRAAPQAAAQVKAEAQSLRVLEQPPVDHAEAAFRRGLPGQVRSEVGVGHYSYFSTDGTPWHQEQLYARMHGEPIAKGITAWVDLSAVGWTQRPDGVNDQPQSLQLHVWELQVTARGEDRRWTGSIGRLLPWRAPGATRVDGAQAGIRSERGDEIGLFGGGIPDVNTLAPDFGSATGGIYWSLERRPGAVVRFVQQQGRIALVSTPALGKRVEGEVTALASLDPRLDLGLGLRAGAGGPLGTALESVRTDLTGHPLEALSLSAGFQWVGTDRPEYSSYPAGAGISTAGGRSRGADLSATWLFGSLSLGAVAGFARDLSTGLRREWAGPEVGLPRLFGDRGGLAAGYREEPGWLPARSAWLQAFARALGPFDLLARATWSQQLRPDAGDDQEVGFYTRLAARLGGLWELRFEGLVQADPRSPSKGLVAGSRLDASAAARF